MFDPEKWKETMCRLRRQAAAQAPTHVYHLFRTNADGSRGIAVSLTGSDDAVDTLQQLLEASNLRDILGMYLNGVSLDEITGVSHGKEEV